MTRRSSTGEFIKEMYIEINPEDAAALGVEAGEKLKVTSRRGEVSGDAKITERVPAGTVFPVPYTHLTLPTIYSV